MAEQKIRVSNPNNHNVGVYMLNGTSRNIPPKGFILASEDEIANWQSTTTLFSAKHLTFDNVEVAENVGLTEQDLIVDSDEEIEKKLNGSLSSVRKYLEDVKDFHLRKRICDVAKSADLKASKLKLIEEIFEVEIVE